MDLSIISSSNLARFETRGTKATNDADAKIREQIVAAFLHLLFVDPSSEKTLPSELRNSDRYLRVQARLLAAFERLPARASRSGSVVGFTHRGGRRTNHDFDIFLSDAPTSSELRLELKFGGSIHDQPQILQLYVNNPGIQGTLGLHYGHYFYDDGYLHRICEEIGVQPPARAPYLAALFGTRAAESPFVELRKARTEGGYEAWIDEVVHESIDAYLTALGNDLPGFINIGGLETRLIAQTDKYFLSIDPDGGDYAVEQILPIHLTATGETSFLTRPSGTKSSLRVHMQSGAVAVALLRWKNRNGVLGPAWQVDLKPPPGPG